MNIALIFHVYPRRCDDIKSVIEVRLALTCIKVAFTLAINIETISISLESTALALADVVDKSAIRQHYCQQLFYFIHCDV